MRLAGDWRLRTGRFAPFQFKPVVQRVPRPRDISPGWRFPFMPNIVSNESARHTEHDIRLKIRIIAGIDLGKLRFITLFEGHEVNMRRPQVVSPLRSQQVPHRTRHGYWIACRLDTSKPEMAFCVRCEPAAQVHIGLRWIFIFIKTF